MTDCGVLAVLREVDVALAVTTSGAPTLLKLVAKALAVSTTTTAALLQVRLRPRRAFPAAVRLSWRRGERARTLARRAERAATAS